VRFRGCQLFACPHSCILIADSHHNELIRCAISRNGTDTGTASQFDHAVYVQASDNLISECRIWASAGYGVHAYNGSGVGVDNNVIRYCRIFDHENKPGILLGSGDGNVAFQNKCWGNEYGVHVYGTSTGAIVRDNDLRGNALGSIFESPGSSGTIISGNLVDP